MAANFLVGLLEIYIEASQIVQHAGLVHSACNTEWVITKARTFLHLSNKCN